MREGMVGSWVENSYGRNFLWKDFSNAFFEDFQFLRTPPFLRGCSQEELQVFGESLREPFYKKVLSKSFYADGGRGIGFMSFAVRRFSSLFMRRCPLAERPFVVMCTLRQTMASVSSTLYATR
jgi:hypothetical protein